MPLATTLQSYATLCDQRLDQILVAPSVAPSKLHEAMRYSALLPGKRLRPALAMASCEALGGDRLTALDAGCAIELIHCFSLIHDDLPCIDDDDLRRGSPTCHIKFGEALAVLAGDALFALAFEVALSSIPDPVAASKVARRLAEAAGSTGLVGGEVMDILAEGADPEPVHLKEIHRRKTGMLIGASCAVGAITAGVDDAQVDRLHEIGHAIGLAFQVQDDILNEISTPEELGKAVGSDRTKMKMTYPSVFGLEESKRLADQAVNEALDMIEHLPNPEPLAQIAIVAVQRSK